MHEALGFQLEHVVQQGRARRAQQHEQSEHAQVRRVGEDAQARSRGLRRETGRRIDRTCSRTICRCGWRKTPDGDCAHQVQHRKNRQHRADAEHGCDLVRDNAAEQAAKRAGALNLPEAAFRGARIEAVRRDQPESRPEHRAEAGNLQIHEHRGGLVRLVREKPFQDQHPGAGCEQHGHERRRRDSGHDLRARGDESDRHDRRRDDHRRKGRHVEMGEVECVSRRLARDVLGRQRGEAHHRRQDVRGRPP